MLPPLDSRDNRAIIEQLKEMLPFYTPEWRFSPEDPDAGTALFLIFARMFEGTIKRLNLVPQRNLAAFLNMMDIKLLPAAPASAYLNFKLSSVDGDAVMVPAGTQALATTAAGEEIVFETESNLLVSPASPVAIYSSSGEHDRIVEVPAGELVDNPGFNGQPVDLLDCFYGDNIQEHCFFLGESDLLNIKGRAVLEVEIKNSRKQSGERLVCELLANPLHTEWTYRTADNWQAFQEVSVRSNRIVLKKGIPGWIGPCEVNGINQRWLCCRVKPGKIQALRDIELDAVSMMAKNIVGEEETGLVPDMLFYNDIPLDPDECDPFGEFFSLYDTFYLASQEALSKKKAIITVAFKLSHTPRITNNDTTPAIEWKMIMKKSALQEPEHPNILLVKVLWEYWNGSGWTRLFNGSQYEEVFLHTAELPKTIKFQCPDDMKPTVINDHLNYWIRARVLSIHNIYAPDGVYHSPHLQGVRLSYEYVGEGLEPSSVLSLNNLSYSDHGKELIEKNTTVRPLLDLDLPCPAAYLGFERPPEKGPLSLFFSLREQNYDPDDFPALLWEYSKTSSGQGEWASLDVIDETNNLSRSGLLVFAAPVDFGYATMFGRQLYWIRAVNYDCRLNRTENRPVSPAARGLYMNTVRALQQERAFTELAANTSGEADFALYLPRTPVVREEVWVEESLQLSEGEKEELLGNNDFSLREVRDEWGNIHSLWIKWQRVEDFTWSGPGDRHYTIDTSTGKVCFGDNRQGRIPPRSANSNIEIRYWTGGGDKGNVGTGKINRLRNSLPFINGVMNPQAACGGCDRETFNEALRRGPYSIKHYGRAVSAEDFETLAREASRNVARAKCLPNTNWRGERESGCLTLVILPQGGVKSSSFFPALKQEVEEYLYQRTSANLLYPGKLLVREPLYLEISVTAVLVTDNINNMLTVETEALDKLRIFLQPELHAGNGRKWNIGEYPHISVLYTLLKSIAGVNYIENVSMTVHKLLHEKRIEIDPDKLGNIAHGFVLNGTHQVKVKVRI